MGNTYYRWEYKIVSFGKAGKNLEQRLNEAGSLGWELVKITETQQFIFKRQVFSGFHPAFVEENNAQVDGK